MCDSRWRSRSATGIAVLLRSKHEIGGVQDDGTAQDDAEIGGPVTIDVTRNSAGVAGDGLAQITGMVGKGTGADEAEGLVSRKAGLCVDLGHVDPVAVRVAEISDQIGRVPDPAVTDRGELESVCTIPASKNAGPCSADQNIAAGSAIDLIATRIAEQPVTCSAADQLIISVIAVQFDGHHLGCHR